MAKKAIGKRTRPVSVSEEGEVLHPTKTADALLCEERGIEITPLDSTAAPWAPIPTTPAGASLASKLRESTAKKESTVPPHIIVIARAGTGKTWTLVEGIAHLLGKPTLAPPSEQQRAIWDCMALSKGVRSIGTVCFNKSIATTLQSRLKERNIAADAMTLHSMGYKAVRKAFPSCQFQEHKVQEIIASLLDKDLRQIRKESPTLLSATDELVRHCKSNLSDGNLEDLTRLASHYDVEMADDCGLSYREEVFDLVPQVLERCKDVSLGVDYSDMVWLPVALNLPVYRYDFLLVDEAQDLTPCQRELAKKAGRRLFLCGDPKQAIYGFAGAATTGIADAEADLRSSGAAVETFPLTVTRRCGVQIVKEARKIVPDFEAHGWEISPDGECFKTEDDATPEGEIGEDKYPLQKRADGSRYELPYEDTYLPLVEEGDFILCRVNAPLVSQCFRFLRMGKRANIQGRKVGEGLLSTIKKLGAHTVPALISGIGDWLHKELEAENAKRNPSENRLINLQDRADCLLCFCEGASSVSEVEEKIRNVFTDGKQCPKCKKQGREDQDDCYICKVPLVSVPGIRLSSIHRAKGLEANRVFFLMPEGSGCPHPMAKSEWQIEQEWNLRYVAITRAIRELTYIY